jgi:hypothetical protein
VYRFLYAPNPSFSYPLSLLARPIDIRIEEKLAGKTCWDDALTKGFPCDILLNIEKGEQTDRVRGLFRFYAAYGYEASSFSVTPAMGGYIRIWGK